MLSLFYATANQDQYTLILLLSGPCVKNSLPHQSISPITSEKSMVQIKDSKTDKFVSPWPQSQNPTPARCLSSLCNVIHQEKQSGEQGAARRKSQVLREKGKDLKSHLYPDGKHFCYRETGFVTSGWEWGDCRGCVVLHQKMSQLLVYAQPASAAPFYKLGSWNLSQESRVNAVSKFCIHQKKKYWPITGNFMLSILPEPMLHQMALQHFSTATLSFLIPNSSTNTRNWSH